jgi:hypothetical protein
MSEGVCGKPQATADVVRASRPLWREHPAPAPSKPPRQSKKGRSKLKLKSMRARAGCPCYSGRDARATSDVPSGIQAFLNFRNGTRTKI